MIQKSALAAALLVPSISFAATVLSSPPELNNKSYVLMDYETGQILASKNENEKLAPASMTKMMTSFIIEQKLLAGELTEDEKVRMNESAWCRGSSSESCMYVPLNGTATALEMLRGIIIQSGNDASKAMAEHIAGNEGTFVHMMNTEAKRIGMTNTSFMNSTGMPAEGHYSTAKDMATLAQHIIHDSSKYYPIYSEKEFTFNGIKQGNRNALLYTDPSVDGLKTGHTDEAGYCLTTSAKRGPMRLISVIFGAPSMQERATQTREILAWGYANFETKNVQAANQVLAKSKVWFGKESDVQIGLAETFNVTMPKGQANAIKTQLVVQPKLTAPLKKGQVVGKYVASLDGKVIAEKPLVALKDVEEAGFFARMLDHIKQFFSNLF
ncbi:D-alanyl-D-alanine carboxypeptidase PBP5/6 [Acinetobacter johnsonii]|jgi:serine-type D-Ala-D-Ala carboxypeptidase (penicillin-binding protein 5/6)|uniref:serine-type D-Ala-D-Ala carboxypeptidase n=3 Tax=Acinetobacter johnsonii TaxID=40214 RepID=A0A0W8H1V9_ACIJO|nr:MULTISPECIES: D-alanyl-D-alanine carboxypeptidase PBP5/6 [Acinetobacter]MDA0776888.1 D-alanyl-D-alanine carboxypeptidase PBP5/6 [Pseudomonadota bacterium]MDN5542674.1 D-alanyl-D-alanine carboxypeptidase PBP5/6 [Acinetobacter sp.]NWK63087.1 D-alanyl-D-alanine carboxypeptidase PBP5/6 [Acinetobacter sp. SwsAc3]OHC20584.1 MAG: serine-type D-Ala-D-Ala carboxypeptidase [Pseudomonadales bacterium RIFCSPHIGHO2_12_FULL_40_16]AXF46016.1 D-alanyl-D-alanine carboxypeptidase [Acinetobacter johnsonii]